MLVSLANKREDANADTCLARSGSGVARWERVVVCVCVPVFGFGGQASDAGWPRRWPCDTRGRAESSKGEHAYEGAGLRAGGVRLSRDRDSRLESGTRRMQRPRDRG